MAQKRHFICIFIQIGVIFYSMSQNELKGRFIFVIKFSFLKSTKKTATDYFIAITDNYPEFTAVFYDFYHTNKEKHNIEITDIEIFSSYRKKLRVIEPGLIKALKIVYTKMKGFKIVGIAENDNDYVFGLRCHNGSVPILGSLPAIRKKDLSYHPYTMYNNNEFQNLKPTWKTAIILHDYYHIS